MAPGEEAAHGPGEEDDEGPSTPWLPPDDRLWRHPSEVRSNPPAPAPVPARGVRRWFRGDAVRPWLIGATSGVVGALVCVGILMSAGALDQPTPITTHIASTGGGESTTPSTGAGPPNASAIYDSVEPSVVGLTITTDSGVENGSGVVVLSSGPTCYVLTASSLFPGASSSTPVSVESYLGEVANGHLVGTDPSAGIAVVRVDLCVTTGRYPAVTPATPGSVADVQTGEEVFSVGSTAEAASVNGSDFTSGIMDDATSYLGPANGESNAVFSMLGADIAVDQSAYGGALVDSTGALIGITNNIPGATKAGYTYVTPIDTAMADVPAIIKDGQPAAHAWLGVLQETDISGSGARGLKVPGAIEVQNMSTGSPAAKAGIDDNDVITSIDGSNGNVTSVGAFVAWMALAKPGQVVNINWLHNDELHQAHVTRARGSGFSVAPAPPQRAACPHGGERRRSGAQDGRDLAIWG
jgi:putative serine protease PepD